jgi:hypothetical protein
MSLKRKHNETANREPCARCWSMTATLRGLKMLISDVGFEHYDKKQLRKSARLACPVCAILNYESYDLQMPSGFNGPLRVAAIATHEHVGGVVHADPDHPFRSKKLIGLYIKNSNSEFESIVVLERKGLKAYTSYGK